MKKELRQVTFSMGMIESVKNDLPVMTQNGFTSVHYLENFSPNVTEGALVKRSGWRFVCLESGTISIAPIIEQPVTGNVNYQQNGPFLTFNTGDFCSYWKHTIEKNSDRNEVLALEAFTDQRGPGQAYSVWSAIRFWRRNYQDWFIETDQNGTMIVAWLKELGSGTFWRNPFVNSYTPNGGTPISHVYPGWMPRGIYTDHSRYGSSVVFTTELNKYVDPVDTAVYRTGTDYPTATPERGDQMYPCYVWELWDISYKRDKGQDQFWNIQNAGYGTPFRELDELVPLYKKDNKFQTYKVRYPSMWITRNDAAGFVELNSVGDVFTSTMDRDIEVCIVEQDFASVHTSDPERWYGNPNDKTSTPKYLPADYTRGVDTNANPWERPVLYRNPYLNSDLIFSESLEVFDGIEVAMEEQHRKYTEMYSGEAKEYGVADTVANWMGQDYEMRVIGCPLKMHDPAPREDGKMIGGRMYAPNEDRHPQWGKGGYAVLPLRVPNYLENQTPRSWVKGEKIPFVLTAVINGIELFVKDFTYEVKKPAYMPNPTMFAIENNRTLRWELQGTNYVLHDYSWNTALFYFCAVKPPDGTETVWSEQSLSRLFYGAYEGGVMIEGKQAFPQPCIDVPGYNKGRYYEVAGNVRYYRTINHALMDYPLRTWVAAAWEPFNPSQQPPYTASLSRPTGDYYFGMNIADTDNRIGYRPSLTVPHHILALIRINAQAIDKLIELGLEKLNLYVAKADLNKSRIRSLQTFSINKEVPQGYYSYPVTEKWDDNPNDYGLFHSFVLDGKKEPFADWDDHEYWKRYYKGEPTQTSAWLAYYYNIISWANNKDGTLAPHPLGWDLSYVVPPDKYLWDYATAAPPLLLGDVNYWQGRGARSVQVVKGRTFLGGCIDKYGEEENGRIRFSLVQNGVVSKDVFVESDWIQLGAEPVAAMHEFREQLWVFSRNELYRIQMPSVTDVDSWEVLEKVTGQGTWNNKTAIVIPDGVLWANHNGLFVSVGTDIINLAESIMPTWQWITMGNSNPLTAYNRKYSIFTENNTNPFLQVDYDPDRKIVVVSSPIRSENVEVGSVELHYSLEKKTWHIESRLYPEYGDTISREVTLFEP